MSTMLHSVDKGIASLSIGTVRLCCLCVFSLFHVGIVNVVAMGIFKRLWLRFPGRGVGERKSDIDFLFVLSPPPPV